MWLDKASHPEFTIGKFKPRIHVYPLFLFSDAVQKLGPLIQSAKAANVQVVSEDVLDEVKKEGIVSQIKEKNICDWGSEVNIVWLKTLIKNPFFIVLNQAKHSLFKIENEEGRSLEKAGI